MRLGREAIAFAYAIREDVKEGLRESLPHDVAVKNAPDTDGTFFEVPKVIEDRRCGHGRSKRFADAGDG